MHPYPPPAAVKSQLWAADQKPATRKRGRSIWKPIWRNVLDGKAGLNHGLQRNPLTLPISGNTKRNSPRWNWRENSAGLTSQELEECDADRNDTTMNDERKAPEAWAIIPSFPDYAASSYGNIRRISPTLRGKKPSGKNLAQTPNGTGMYLSVSVCRDAKAYNRRVNRLVCEAFYGPPPSRIHHAAHIDGRSKNNSSENLRWALPVENEFDKRAHGTITTGERHWTFGRDGDPVRGVNHGRAKLDDDKVRLIRSDNGYQRDIAARFGVSQKTVFNIKKNIIWKHVT